MIYEFTCAVCGGRFRRGRRGRADSVRCCSTDCRNDWLRSHRSVRSGAENNRFNSGLSTMADGRTIIVGRDGSLTYYYRALMEAHLGRALLPDEIVHHVNGDPSDDRIENLAVMSRPEHARLHNARH